VQTGGVNYRLEPFMRQRRILVVDDSEIFLRAVEAILTSSTEIELVGSAHSGMEALERVGQLEPNLVLVDFAMPAMDGLEVTRRLATRPSRPCVIIMTAHDEDEYRQAAIQAGADGFLHKSDLNDQLLPLIRTLLPGYETVIVPIVTKS
jgi:DNA-binding NarL/FixJ family response regulator